MTPEQFAYWLQGFAEIRGSAPTEYEWGIIRDHLATVFNKVTPNRQPLGPASPSIPNPIGPYVTPPNHWTTPPNWPRPEVICSVAPGAGTNWSSGAGDAVYCHFTNSSIEATKKLNKDLK